MYVLCTTVFLFFKDDFHVKECILITKFYNLPKYTRVLGHHYYILGLSMGVEKKIFFFKNAFSLYELYDHALAQEPLPRPRGSWNLHLCLNKHSLVNITIYLVCLINAWEYRRNTSSLHFYPRITPLPWCRGHEIYNFLSPYPTDAIFQIWLKITQ